MSLIDRIVQAKARAEKDEREQMMQEYVRLSERTSGPARNQVLTDMANLVRYHHELYLEVPDAIRFDTKPGNPFFEVIHKEGLIESERAKIKTGPSYVHSLTEHGTMRLATDYGAYKRSLEEQEKRKEDYEVAQRREKARQKADFLQPEAKKEMLDAGTKWANLYQKGLLSDILNAGFSSKMVNAIRKNQGTYSLLPQELRNNPGAEASRPFYTKVRRYLDQHKEEIDGILLSKDDPRKAAVVKMVTDTRRDEVLRENPERGRMYREALQGKAQEEGVKKPHKAAKDLDDIVKPNPAKSQPEKVPNRIAKEMER